MAWRKWRVTKNSKCGLISDSVERTERTESQLEGLATEKEHPELSKTTFCSIVQQQSIVRLGASNANFGAIFASKRLRDDRNYRLLHFL